MVQSKVEHGATRCPYCQSVELTRLPESDSLPIDVYRCRGCGTQFNIKRPRDDGEPPEELTIA